MLARFGHEWPGFAHIWDAFQRIRPAFGQVRLPSMLAQLWPHSTACSGGDIGPKIAPATEIGSADARASPDCETDCLRLCLPVVFRTPPDGRPTPTRATDQTAQLSVTAVRPSGDAAQRQHQGGAQDPPPAPRLVWVGIFCAHRRAVEVSHLRWQRVQVGFRTWRQRYALRLDVGGTSVGLVARRGGGACEDDVAAERTRGRRQRHRADDILPRSAGVPRRRPPATISARKRGADGGSPL